MSDMKLIIIKKYAYFFIIINFPSVFVGNYGSIFEIRIYNEILKRFNVHRL